MDTKPRRGLDRYELRGWRCHCIRFVLLASCTVAARSSQPLSVYIDGLGLVHVDNRRKTLAARIMFAERHRLVTEAFSCLLSGSIGFGFDRMVYVPAAFHPDTTTNHSSCCDDHRRNLDCETYESPRTRHAGWNCNTDIVDHYLRYCDLSRLAVRMRAIFLPWVS